MHKYTRDKLELDKIINCVLEYAKTDLGQEVIKKLKPASDPEYIKEKLAEVTAARDLIENFGLMPLGGIRDLREILKKANKGVVLSTSELLQVRSSLRGFRELKNYFQNVVDDSDPAVVDNLYAILTKKAFAVKILSGLQGEIDSCIDQYGDIKDSASPKLKSIRKRIQTTENRIRDKLDSIVKGQKYQKMLQEQLVTRRENRYVVPVKHEFRNTFKGIVHDQSTSGMTVFMEPMAVVEMNNQLREIKAEEEQEIQRILQELTAKVAQKSELIKENLKLATFLDVVFARASYSNEIQGTAPTVNKRGYTSLKQARHPLLQNEPVPIDVEVGDDFTSLVITGPNTGGKTVALKTVGLLVLMAELGLHVPADHGTEICLYEDVFADIGDEQSIEQNLSTFSSHMNKIKTYLQRADDSSLVLLDELGAGTDPREGAALGISILEKFKSRQVVTVATTHYSELKSYAYSTAGVENASVEFDLETLRPTYRLIMGVPGGSNAFEIALRLGLPEEIITEAKKLVDKEDLQIEDIIKDLNEQRKRYRELKEKNQQTDRELTKMKEEYETKLARLEERENNILKEAKEEAQKIVQKARKKTKAIIRDLKDEDFTARPAVDRKDTEIRKEMNALEDQLGGKKEETPEQTTNEDLKVGDQVRVRSLGKKGRIQEIDQENDEVTIQAGIMKVTAESKDVSKVELEEIEEKEMVKKYQVNKTQQVKPSIDLRGERFQEAQRQLDKYIDDALLAGYSEVEIVHGKGTGALQKAVSEVLEEHSQINSFRLGKQKEGGAGVTIARLKK
ncbi:MAG: endonuclease MutS2 [Bacillota bacterium]